MNINIFHATLRARSTNGLIRRWRGRRAEAFDSLLDSPLAKHDTVRPTAALTRVRVRDRVSYQRLITHARVVVAAAATATATAAVLPFLPFCSHSLLANCTHTHTDTRKLAHTQTKVTRFVCLCKKERN